MAKKDRYVPPGILGIFPEAAKSFQFAAATLAGKLAVVDHKNSPDPAFMPDVVTLSLVAPKVNPITTQFNKRDGEVARFCWFEKSKLLGLQDVDYKALAELVSKIHKLKSVKTKLSRKLVLESVFLFLLVLYRKAHPEVQSEFLDEALEAVDENCESVCDFLEKVATREVAEYAVLCPIANTYIEHDIELGPVKLTTLTREHLQKWTANAPEEHRDALLNRFKPLQGLAAGSISTSDIGRAKELAFELTEEAIALVRFFSGGALLASSVTEMVLYGREPQNHSFVVTEVANSDVFHIQHGMLFGDQSWTIRKAKIAEMFQMGLQHLVDWSFGAEPTPFQSDLLKSIRLISKAAVRRNVEDKLLYVLSAVESFFLRDSGEPIQNNIGERLAFARKNDEKQRKQVVSLVKTVYAHRSGFFHHGQEIEDLEVVQKFMTEIWLTFASLINLGNDYQTRAEFIDDIEVVKFGGTPKNSKLVLKRNAFTFTWGEVIPERPPVKSRSFRWGRKPKRQGDKTDAQ